MIRRVRRGMATDPINALASRTAMDLLGFSLADISQILNGLYPDMGSNIRRYLYRYNLSGVGKSKSRVASFLPGGL
jgi:hypothetical protein